MKLARNLRTVLALALVAVPVSMALTSGVEAARLSTVSDVLSDSGLSAESDHVITFTATSGIAATDTITLTFDDAGDAFDLTGVSDTDMTMASGTCGSETADTLGAAASGATWGVNVNTTTDVITITSGTDTVTADDCVVISIDGANTINNPSVQGVYDLDIATTSDTGKTLLAIVPHVTADVTVDETLTFTVSGVAGASCTTVADVDTTATSVSFGSVTANTFYDACQGLLVSTNATGGYSVTLQQDGDLTSAGLDTIDPGTCDGACAVATEAAWATATNNGFAFCIDNVTGTDGAFTNACSAGGSAGYRLLGTLGTDTPEVIMTNTGFVDSNEVEVGYRISVAGDQPAGTYQNDLVYVATPTY